jgi:fatty-acyl-CoA synthase
MQNQGIGDWPHRRRVKSAGAVAVVSGDRRREYGAFAERVDRIADALEQRGIRAGDRVAYLGLNSVEFLETLFGVTAAGAVFVPLNTRWAGAEIAYATDDSGARLLIHDAGQAAIADGLEVETVIVGADGDVGFEAFVASGAAAHRDRRVVPADPAVILYTSGTTGRPKGAILTHGNLTWNSINVLVDYDVTSTDVALMVSPLFHVAALGMGALPVLLKGGTLVLQERFDPAAVLRAVREHGVTMLSGVPTTFKMLAEHDDWQDADLSTLRTLTCGGSPVPAQIAAMYEARGLAFSSGYGMTETSPGATSLSALHSRDHAATSGLPHFFTDVRVVGEDGADLPAGQVGEILISGPNVTPGYWNRPDATAEAIEDGWFRSGDLGCVDADGFLTIVDRAKDMFVSGGENVYPAEIEGILLELPQVAAVAVIGIPDERWGETGRAIVVPAPGAEVSLGDLTAHLDGRVGRFKVPRSLVIVPELPVTATGKILKGELRRLYGQPG